MLLCEVQHCKIKKYIDKIFEEKVGKSLKRELFWRLCKLFVIKKLRSRVLKGA